MPNRILKESICVSGSLDKLSWFEEVMFYRLIVSCDDYGRYDGRTVVIKNRLFPLKNDLTLQEVEAALMHLAELGLVKLYEAEGSRFLCLPTWLEHQNVRAKRSKYPAPESICIQMQANVPDIQSNTRSVSNTRVETHAAFIPPTENEVSEYCRELGSAVDPARFCDYYRSRGWTVGSGKMTDWKASLRMWNSSEKQKKPPSPPPPDKKDGQKQIDRLRKLSEKMQGENKEETIGKS